MDVKRQTGIEAPELTQIPPLPVEAAYLWGWFCDLSRARGRDAAGAPLPVAWEAIWSMFGLLRIEPLPWEIQAIIRLDDAYLDSRCSEFAGPAAGSAAQLRTAYKGRGP